MASGVNTYLVNSGNKELCPSEKFDSFLSDLVSTVGLREITADKYYRWFLDTTISSSVRENRNNFNQVFTSHFEEQGKPILERSCFYQKPLSTKQEQIDSIHYICLRTFDTIFDVQEDFYTDWVDNLFDQGGLTAGQAILIQLLVSNTICSLMQYDSDDSEFSKLLKIKLNDPLIAEFVRSLELQKRNFPFKDVEIVLFTEVFHALSKIKGFNQRVLFVDFLERFISSVKKYNAEIKSAHCDHLKSVHRALLMNKESPTMELELKSVPKMRFDGLRYWLIRNFDETMKCRSSYAASVDKLRDEGFLTLSAANALLALEENQREWNVHNFKQNLLSIQEKHHLDLDMDFLERAFFSDFKSSIA